MTILPQWLSISMFCTSRRLDFCLNYLRCSSNYFVEPDDCSVKETLIDDGGKLLVADGDQVRNFFIGLVFFTF